MGKRFASALITLSLLVFLISPLTATAQGSGQGLEISPPLLDLKADPGQTIKSEIRVRNVTKDTLVVKAQFEDFVASGEDGQPKILLNPDEKSPYSIKDWLGATPSVTLAPEQRETIPITITVPQDASPGGHYGVVRFTGAPPEVEGTGVSLSASVGTLILVNVSGDIKESAKIAELFVSKNGKRANLFEYGPLDFTLRIENNGNIHLQPKGTVQVTNIFGKTVYLSQINQEGRNVLPSSIRKFEQSMGSKLMFGPYKLKADVVYGSSNQITSDTVTFWVIPYKVIIGTLLLIFLIVFAFRRYNRFIINRASKNHNVAPKKPKKKLNKFKK
ncbi:DUF916 domain-containing protein [Candidatus Saccharibacteria bacterium]|nr:DUF916 domain-containing protein [Candidatus Saccharibacteria bacterium]